MEKTYVIKGKTEPHWIVVDAEDQPIGRLATQIASYLMGKHKPTFTPGVLMGDSVIVINASKLRLSAKSLIDKKYYRHSGYPGGLRTTTLKDMMAQHPERVIRQAVWGMLPHTKSARALMKRLRVYPGAEHPHEAQEPQTVA